MEGVKNLPAKQEAWVRFLGWEDPLEKEMATHSNILAWRIPMDRGTWWTTVHGVAKSQTLLRDWNFHIHGGGGLIAKSCLTLVSPMDCSLPGSSPMGFSRQEYWSGLPFPSLGNLPNPGIEPRPPALQADSLLTEPPGKPIFTI